MSARINGKYLYEIWPDEDVAFEGIYYGATGLSDYGAIPDCWKMSNDGGIGGT